MWGKYNAETPFPRVTYCRVRHFVAEEKLNSRHGINTNCLNRDPALTIPVLSNIPKNIRNRPEYASRNLLTIDSQAYNLDIMTL